MRSDNPRVPMYLRDAAAIYEERNKLYGQNYHRFGIVMGAIFPEGVTLNGPLDHNRFGIFVQMVAKLTRYANMWERGHNDSLDDLAVYTMMLKEIDEDLIQ